MELILASTSQYRRELLSRLGFPFRCEAPGVDENISGTPREISAKLALEKAKAVQKKFPKAIVIGSDQLAALGDEILGKPGSREKALAQLKKLSGKTHTLFTSLAVLTPGKEFLHTDETKLEMLVLTEGELGQYLDFDKPFDCAGSYKIESRGISLIKRIQSEDFTAIEGLPLLKLGEILRGLQRTS